MNKSVGRTLFALPLVIIGLGVIWLSAGRTVTMVVDRIAPLGVSTTHVDHVAFDGEGFRIAGLSLTFGALNNQRSDVVLCTDRSNRIVLKSGGQSFILGPRTSPADTSGRPDIAFVRDPHDEVKLTTTRSLVGWPTPFETSFMTRSPWWKRYVYYRLVWKKASGAELTMSWRYEQDYYAGSGWTDPVMMWNWQTGLVGVEIRSR